MERDELIKKYNIDIKSLEKEQEKLSKSLDIKDKVDFDLCNNFGAISNFFIGNKIISCIIVCNRDFEIIDSVYSVERVNFPYLPEFRAYRELPAMMSAFNKLHEIPDLMFIFGQGIDSSILGLASHFSIVSGVPSIGISNNLIDCQIIENEIYKNKKRVGKVLVKKSGSRPIYISPGNNISIDSAFNFCNNFIRLPHKLPEPLHLANKYSNKVRKEIKIN